MKSVIRAAQLLTPRRSRLVPPDAGFRTEALGRVLPRGPAEWAWELGPDTLGALAATAYGGPVAGLEDLALGAGGSMGGRMAGSALAYGLARLSGASPKAMRGMVQQGAGMGGLAGGIAMPWFGPRPFTDAMRQQQEQQLLADQQIADQWLLSQAAGSPTFQNYNALLSSLAGGAG